MTRKQKAESKTQEVEHSPKKAKVENEDDGHTNGKHAPDDVAVEYDEFCKAINEHLSVDQLKEILEANGLDSSGSDLEFRRRCQDLLFYGALEKCPVCNGSLEFDGRVFSCKGFYSEWASCTFSTRDPPRKEEPINIPDSVQNSLVSDLLKKYQDPNNRPQMNVNLLADKPFTGMMISLMGRLTRTHHYWKRTIEKHGGMVANSIIGNVIEVAVVFPFVDGSFFNQIALLSGATCLVASPAERDRGGTSKLAEAIIERQEPQPLEAYDLVSDLSEAGKGIPWDKQDPGEEAIESLSAELKLYGKRGVYKDTKLQEQGGKIYEKDGILYNCAFSLCDQGRGLNDYCVMQLIVVPENRLHLYFKKGRVGDDPNAEERLEELDNEDNALKEFVRLFEEVTGNEFEPWEREKKFQKRPLKFYPIDMDDGVEVRHGALGLRQLGIAATHCKLEPQVANFMKVMCSQEIYKSSHRHGYKSSPEKMYANGGNFLFPISIISSSKIDDNRTQSGEEVLLEFIEKVKSLKETGPKGEAVWTDFSQRWFTLMHSTRPFIFRDYQEIAEHAAAALEGVRDMTVASHLIGDMSGSTIDDPLSETYNKLGCSISPLDKDSDDYDMIVKYLEKTYEPVKVGDLFGKAIVCSDAAAEAARYGFTAVDRPEGFLVLAIASLGNETTQLKSPPEDTTSLEEKKVGVKGLGKKKTDESEHFVWKDDIKVPCGQIVASEHQDSPLEYNEYAVYDPKQVRISFLVAVKYDEKDVEFDAAEGKDQE
ncbi:unnamed protein product [Lupinus luteus]|uniref:Poly [ADP-ribose] polymerase n=1 Tax=Lupinus luteus TaxID=3873 RepID=A0AAV1YIX2_LUPLU